MRISTPGFHNAALEALMNQQSELSISQNQVATGKKIQSPADDPIGAVHILELKRSRAELEQYSRNADMITGRLNAEEQALADATTLVQRVRELVLAANNATTDLTARQAIAAELTNRTQQLVDIANRRDGDGNYLFGGYAATSQPFARGTGGVAYAGDQGVRAIFIGPSQQITDGHSGDAVFLHIPEGNGTFAVSANGANTGTGIIGSTAMTAPASWVRDTYTVSFTSATTWQVTNSAAAVVASGAYTSGNTINFNGAQITVSGAPAVGDTFTVTPSQKEDVFTTIDKIVTSLGNAALTQSDRAKLTTELNVSIQQLDQVDQHLTNVRTEVGARLSTIDDTSSSRSAFDVELQRAISKLQDVDYAEAISILNRQMLGLQAAQQSYTRIAQLSLFNYMG